MPGIELTARRSFMPQLRTAHETSHTDHTPNRPGHDGKTGMDSLDERLVSQVLSQLSPTDTLRLSAVNKTWHHAAQHPDVWLNMARRLGATTHLSREDIAALQRRPPSATLRPGARGFLIGGVGAVSGAIATGILLLTTAHGASGGDVASGKISYAEYVAANDHADAMKAVGLILCISLMFPAALGAALGMAAEIALLGRLRAGRARRAAHERALEEVVVQGGQRALEAHDVAPLSGAGMRPVLLHLQKFTLQRQRQLASEAQAFHRAVKGRNWGAVERLIAGGVPQQEATELLEPKHLDAAAVHFASAGKSRELTYLLARGADPVRAHNAQSLAALLPARLKDSVAAADADSLATMGLLQQLLAEHPDVASLARNVMAAQAHVPEAKARLAQLVAAHASLTALHSAVHDHGRALRETWATVSANQDSRQVAAYAKEHAVYRLEQRGLSAATTAYRAYAKAFAATQADGVPAGEALAALQDAQGTFDSAMQAWSADGLRAVATEQAPLADAEAQAARTALAAAATAAHALAARTGRAADGASARAASAALVADAPAPSAAVLPYPAPSAPTATFPYETALQTLQTVLHDSIDAQRWPLVGQLLNGGLPASSARPGESRSAATKLAGTWTAAVDAEDWETAANVQEHAMSRIDSGLSPSVQSGAEAKVGRAMRQALAAGEHAKVAFMWRAGASLDASSSQGESLRTLVGKALKTAIEAGEVSSVEALLSIPTQL